MKKKLINGIRYILATVPFFYKCDRWMYNYGQNEGR